MAAAHLAVAVEDAGAAAGDDDARRALGQREHPALLAADAEVGLLAAGARPLVDGADGAGDRPEQRDGPAQDPVEQGLERELSREVLDGAAQGVELGVRTGTAGADAPYGLTR
ncbi:hypothetical protein GCM10023082_03730 [Streptomyces tremellae]|uniref:Uncharacterized protein n=1 Tax=Streptomyces tremellae TaxID=1124239 RepID=A0ABP7DTP1_9ACTN